MQLQYEFNKVMDEDMGEIMTRNWDHVCTKLLTESDGEMQPVQVVQLIERNIYHKKPTVSVIQFANVSQ